MNMLLLWQEAVAANPSPQGGSTLITVLFWIAIFAVVYLFMIRPQQTARKEGTNFLANLKKGQKVVTIGGIHGTITEITATTVVLLISPKTFITVQRDCISREYSVAANEPATNANETKTDNAPAPAANANETKEG
jgi:preprotein translocase subunit YajC